MTEDQQSNDLTTVLKNEQVQAWMDEHLPELTASASGKRLLYQSLAIGFVIGLAAQIIGYILLLQAPREPLGLFADLLHALGWSLWTGVVVALFIQIIPEAKQRQIRQVLEVYGAMRREQAQTDNSSQDAGLE